MHGPVPLQAPLQPAKTVFAPRVAVRVTRDISAIEDKVKVSESGKDAFRNEIFRKVAMAQRRGDCQDQDHRQHDSRKHRQAVAACYGL
jgi:hypothetical protein